MLGLPRVGPERTRNSASVVRRWSTHSRGIRAAVARWANHARFDRERKPGSLLMGGMDSTNLASARSDLRKREGIPEKNEEKHIGSWSVSQPSPALIPNLAEWAYAHGIAHVIWTNLPPKFNDEERAPSSDQVVQYLAALLGSQREVAERYVRLTPRQIDTTYRRRIEAALQWTALNAK